MFDLHYIKASLPSYLTAIGCEPQLRGQTHLKCRCPLHDDRNPSFTATLKGGVWLWQCFPCGKGGTIVELHAELNGLDARRDFRQILQELEAVLQMLPSPASSVPRAIGKNSEDEHQSRLIKRASWPEFYPLSRAAIEAISALRNLPVAAVNLACASGLLSGILYEGAECFVLHEAEFAQARRLDGKPFQLSDGKTIKAKNLPVSKGAFLGVKWLGNSTPILLVEGAVGLLEAAAAVLISDRTDWTVLAATSASSRFFRDPELLERMQRRHVRILPDNDKNGTGLDAAAIWLTELENAGVIVSATALPSECKDLGPIVANPSLYSEFLETLFL